MAGAAGSIRPFTDPAVDCSPRLPHVLLLGGQDVPTTDQLIRRWRRALAPILPDHRLTVVQWPRTAGGRAGLTQTLTILFDPQRAADRPRASAHGNTLLADLSHRSDRLASQSIARVVRWLDERMRVDQRGQPAGELSRLVYAFTRFSVDALYDRRGASAELLSLVRRALLAESVQLVVAHSFGGTLALRALWELGATPANASASFSLVTLGSASGPTVVHSRLLAGMKDADTGRIRRPRRLARWQHFYSTSDALVAAPALPLAFEGVELEQVDTGPFLSRGRGHALASYLETPEVQRAIYAGLAPARRERCLHGM